MKVDNAITDAEGKFNLDKVFNMVDGQERNGDLMSNSIRFKATGYKEYVHNGMDSLYQSPMVIKMKPE